jgi:hypothetical protein
MRSGFCASTDFEICGVAAARDAAELRLRHGLGQQKFALGRCGCACPAKHQVGCKRIEQDRGGRTRGKNARDFLRRFDDAAGGVFYLCRLRETWCKRGGAECCGTKTGKNGAAIDLHEVPHGEQAITAAA